ncbi:MAG: mu-protocadherin- cell-suface protein, partial [Planctomycetota bacterium]
MPSGIRPPSTGELGDFLGLDKPVVPETGGSRLPNLPSNRPATGTKFPDRGDKRPTRPAGRPGSGEIRPGLEGRLPGSNDRLANRYDIQRPGSGTNFDIDRIRIGNNNVISNRPSWANIDRGSMNQISRRWQSNLTSLNNWPGRYPARFDRWHRWGNSVRLGWGNNWRFFRAGWWAGRGFRFGAWSYCYAFNRYPYIYWWQTPSFTTVSQWFVWSAPASSWQQP